MNATNNLLKIYSFFIYSFLYKFIKPRVYILSRLQKKIKKDFESGIEIRNKKEEKAKPMRARIE